MRRVSVHKYLGATGLAANLDLLTFDLVVGDIVFGFARGTADFHGKRFPRTRAAWGRMRFRSLRFSRNIELMATSERGTDN